MQKQKFEILAPREILRSLESAFNLIPIVPRDCVKAINTLVYNMNHQTFSQEVYKSIIFLVLRAFTSKDNYLKSIVYALLEILSSKTSDGILGINSIVKDVEDRHIPVAMKNSALRALFSNVPSAMRLEFEKFIKAALLDDKSRDTAVCIASEYFKNMKIDSKIHNSIQDYHLSFFNHLPANKYTTMIEIRRIVKNNEDISKISQYFSMSADKVSFFEASKALLVVRQEIAAPYVEKVIVLLRSYLKKGPVEQFLSMKLLNKLSISFSAKVAKANHDIEDLVHASSRTVSMLAILTLLKTGTDETAKQLSSKLEPLMNTMSEPYKIMAIETIEKLAQRSKAEYIIFLKTSFFEKGSIDFKRFILKKLDSLLLSGTEENRKEIMKFLCGYLEDPEHYQISMDILGLLGQHVTNSKELIHIFNRLILDNGHVRTCAYQTLFDLNGKLNTMGALRNAHDRDTKKIRSFLCFNTEIKRGAFDISELGDLKPEVMKYLNPKAEEHNEEGDGELFIKECRRIVLTPENADFSVSVVKRVSKDGFVLLFTFESKMTKVVVNSCLLTIDTGAEKHAVELAHDDFKNSAVVTRELELNLKCDDVVNGVFEYQIGLEGELEEMENDSISLLPFDVNILDFIRPIPVDSHPTNKKVKEIKFKLKPTEAISKIVSTCNMFLIADSDVFELQGYYEDIPVVIKGEVVYSKHTTVYLEISCDDDGVLDKIRSVFD